MPLAVPSRTRSSSVGETSLRKCLRVSDRTHSLRMCWIVWRVPQGQLNSSVSSPLEMCWRHAPTKPWPLRYCTILLSILRGASRKVHFKRNCVTLVVHTILGSTWRNQAPFGSLSYCSCHLSSAFFRSKICLSAYCRSHFAQSASTHCSSHGVCDDPQSVVEDLGHRVPVVAEYSSSRVGGIPAGNKWIKPCWITLLP